MDKVAESENVVMYLQSKRSERLQKTADDSMQDPEDPAHSEDPADSEDPTDSRDPAHSENPAHSADPAHSVDPCLVAKKVKKQPHNVLRYTYWTVTSQQHKSHVFSQYLC